MFPPKTSAAGVQIGGGFGSFITRSKGLTLSKQQESVVGQQRVLRWAIDGHIVRARPELHVRRRAGWLLIS